MSAEKKTEKTITSMMDEKRVFKPSPEISKTAYVKSDRRIFI